MIDPCFGQAGARGLEAFPHHDGLDIESGVMVLKNGQAVTGKNAKSAPQRKDLLRSGLLIRPMARAAG